MWLMNKEVRLFSGLLILRIKFLTYVHAQIQIKYRHTFSSLEAGHQLAKRNFIEGDDFARCQVFGIHKTLWAPIRDKVESWIKEGWETWEEEKPEWFTDHWKASVPEDMKPVAKMRYVDGGDKMAAKNECEEALMVEGEEKQKGRRRSIVEMISGQKAVSSKVMPAGGIKKDIDEEEFLREMNRRGSINM